MNDNLLCLPFLMCTRHADVILVFWLCFCFGSYLTEKRTSTPYLDGFNLWYLVDFALDTSGDDVSLLCFKFKVNNCMTNRDTG